MYAQVQALDEETTHYATATDYYRIFAEEMDSLYFLAFLLTADCDKAEQCFVGALGECIDRIGVGMERAVPWARRAIIRNAIRIIRPAPKDGADGLFVSAKRSAAWTTSNPFAVIVSLGAFDRFVFVISVLEGHSDEDCQSFLRCERQAVLVAREVTFRLFAAANPGWERTESGNHTFPFLLH
jgi:hypothetical protein